MAEPFDPDPDRSMLMALAWAVQECPNPRAKGRASGMVVAMGAEQDNKSNGAFVTLYPKLRGYLEDWDGELADRVKGVLEAYFKEMSDGKEEKGT